MKQYRVWQHDSGTQSMSLREARAVAKQYETASETPRGTITAQDEVQILPSDITGPKSPAGRAYIRKLQAAGKRSL